jgi:hypothetical protein
MALTYVHDCIGTQGLCQFEPGLIDVNSNNPATGQSGYLEGMQSHTADSNNSNGLAWVNLRPLRHGMIGGCHGIRKDTGALAGDLGRHLT